ncbi:MAG: hypothetical protein KatS3mg005_0627 [Bryobacteraceae bacterium]|nr:MAG: hypothetical protein KatS3mg005_0627 [Bryobacteraceae bacterium]
MQTDNSEQVRLRRAALAGRIGGRVVFQLTSASIHEFAYGHKPGSVRLIPTGSQQKLVFRYSDIAGIEFSGRDMAAGKRWQDWVRRYAEKKAAGEKNIQLEPERLD